MRINHKYQPKGRDTDKPTGWIKRWLRRKLRRWIARMDVRC
jgi:hypothetical protein